MVIKCGFNHSFYMDVSPVTHSLTLFILTSTNDCMAYLTLAPLVTIPYCVAGFDIIQPYHHTTAMVSNI